MWNILKVQQNYTNCKQNIDNRHERYKLFRYLSDSLDSTEKDQCDQHRKHNSDHKIDRLCCIGSDHPVVE